MITVVIAHGRTGRALLAAALALAAVVGVRAEPSTGVDAHAVFEQRCASCHKGHMLDMVRSGHVVAEVAAAPRGRSGAALSDVLADHHGVRLTPAEVQALSSLAGDIARSGFVFRDKCASCHISGRNLAVRALELRDDRVVRRQTGQPVEAYLANHGMLSPDEATTVMMMFRRQLAPR